MTLIYPAKRNCYQSKYGSAALRERNEYHPDSQEAETDSIGIKNKVSAKNNNHKGFKALASLALIAGGIFAGYKGKAPIKNLGASLKKYASENMAKFKAKYPNLSQSLSSLKKAGETPLSGVKQAGSKIIASAKNLFKKTTA